MYRKLIHPFEIKAGDIIWLSSDIIKLSLSMKRKGMKFEPAALLDAFQNAVGAEGTVLIPTFCFDFSNNGKYDYCLSKGTSGVLGNIALQECGFIRTQHPMHSFAVWGKDADMLFQMQNKHSFGEDSPFKYCRDKNVKQIMLGTDYRHAMTFIHYVETVCNVPYRFSKNFTGTYVSEDRLEETRTYEYAARLLDVGAEEKFNRIGTVLEKMGIARKIIICDCISHEVLLGDSFQVIHDDVMKNQCGNIYDFTVSRKDLFEGFGE